MKGRIQAFVLTQVRRADEAIVEVRGREGFWPLRRPVRFKVGANCDSIAVEDGELTVRRNGAPIAAADLQHPGAQRWGWLLFPRHMRADKRGEPPRE